MNFKQFSASDNQWHDVPYYIHKTSTDTLTNLPADIYANDNNATVGLKGNMEQSSQPSPTTPIQPQECGDMTGNLFDKSTWDNVTATRGTVDVVANGIRLTATANDAYTQTYGNAEYSYPVTAGETYTLSWDIDNPNVYGIVYLFSGSTTGDTVLSNVVASAKKATFTIPNGHQYLSFRLGVSSSGDTLTYTNLMLNTGSTAKPYEPFGIKIPILNNSQTTNVYLGEVESTRKIYKTVLTGQETWTRTSTGKMYSSDALDNVPNYNHLSRVTTMCSHYKCVVNRGNTSGLKVNELCLYGTDFFSTIKEIYIYPEDYATAADFATYLQQQYAAGTPVTVWYVLNTPETAVVNEPLRKIGTYADEVSGITIPTIAGANTLSVGTTLQPSEVTVNYKGWHPVADVHEADNGAWT